MRFLRILLILLLPLLLFPVLWLSARTSKPVTNTQQVSYIGDSSLSRADSLIAFARLHLGTPYKFASADPKAGFDCSGFAYYVFKNSGIELPRSSRDMDNIGADVKLEECRKGDLILFRGTDASDKTIGHVGIIISDPGKPVEFIHSSSSKKHWGVVITTMDDAYTKRFVKVKRVL